VPKIKRVSGSPTGVFHSVPSGTLLLQLCTYRAISKVRHMAQKKRVTKGGKTSGKKSGSSAKAASSGVARKSRRRKSLSLSASAEPSKRRPVSMDDVLEFYKPIKKPVTLRLDADVLAWFQREGRRYQTRINAALRRVMEREMKAS
jgi:uncharacterized protein (DUF4415 family)